MHTVELLDAAVNSARQVGFKVRFEWLGGAPAGACEIKGQKWLFVDLALTPTEQLDQVLTALAAACPADESLPATLQLPEPLTQRIHALRAA